MKRLARRILLIGSLAAIALAGAIPATAGAWSAGWYGRGAVQAACIRTPQDLVYAHVTTTMWVHNTGISSHWVTNMRLQARLISPNAGLQLQRSWRTKRYPAQSELLQDHNYSFGMAVNTDVVKPDADWLVEVKLIWDRKVPLHDIVQKIRHFEFDTSDCRDGAAPRSGNGPPIGIPQS